MAKEKTNGAAKSARQDRLPGMADAKIQALHNVKSPEDAEKSETKAAKKPDKRTEFDPAAMSGTTNT